MQKQIFISHAHKDKALVDKFADLLVSACGATTDMIFATSLEGLGIPAGNDFLQFIKYQIQSPSLTVLMLSPNYFDSVFCLCELGATWGLSTHIYPIIVPPLELASLRDTLSVTQGGKITDEAYLDQLRDTILKVCGIEAARSPTNRLNAKRDIFLRGVQPILNELPSPHRVSAAEHQKLKMSYEASLQEAQEAQVEIVRLKKIIDHLSEIKDREKVQDVLIENSDEWDMFDDLVQNANTKLAGLSTVVRKALYADLNGQSMSIDE